MKREQEAQLEQYKTFYKTAESDEDRQAWRIEIGNLMAKLYSGNELQAALDAAAAEEAALLEAEAKAQREAEAKAAAEEKKKKLQEGNRLEYLKGELAKITAITEPLIQKHEKA